MSVSFFLMTHLMCMSDTRITLSSNLLRRIRISWTFKSFGFMEKIDAVHRKLWISQSANIHGRPNMNWSAYEILVKEIDTHHGLRKMLNIGSCILCVTLSDMLSRESNGRSRRCYHLFKDSAAKIL